MSLYPVVWLLDYAIYHFNDKYILFYNDSANLDSHHQHNESSCFHISAIEGEGGGSWLRS